MVTLRVNDPQVVVAAVQAGDLDASFRSITDPAALPGDVAMRHVFDSPHRTSRRPPASAGRRPHTDTATPTTHLGAGHRTPRRIGAVLRLLATEFDLRIDAAGPNFGNEFLLDILADSAEVATLIGSRDRYIWPTSHDLRRIPS